MAEASAYETPALTHRVSADEACAAATGFLLEHVGNQLVAGRPHLMVSAVRTVWVVPVQLAYVHSGTLGDVGVVAVDEETGHVIAWTPIAEMKAASRKLREAHEPELSEQLRAFMASRSGEVNG